MTVCEIETLRHRAERQNESVAETENILAKTQEILLGAWTLGQIFAHSLSLSLSLLICGQFQHDTTQQCLLLAQVM